MKIKCHFCERTTTHGIGEKSGFAHAKMTIGKGKSARAINIYACYEHTMQLYPEIERFIKENALHNLS
jgi:hypothetical protein